MADFGTSSRAWRKKGGACLVGSLGTRWHAASFKKRRSCQPEKRKSGRYKRRAKEPECPELHQFPATKGELHQSPAAKGEPHWVPPPPQEGDCLQLPPPPPKGDYLQLPPPPQEGDYL
ncbi:UNVERIFIED_CONTAM: hypothetical protein FKN15_008185 [Acipenser sinensis]